MELSWLETFLAVTRTGSFRGAARVRYVSQAAVSQQIARLERELGVVLFDRAGRRVTLNPAGVRFVADAERMMALWEESRTSLGREAGRERLWIGADWLTAETVIPWLCRQLLLHRPDADLVVRLMGSGHDEWDVALAGESAEAGGWYGSTLFLDPLVWVTASEAGDLDQPPPDPDLWLRERRVLIPGEARYWPPLQDRLQAKDLRVRAVEISQPSVIKRLVAEGVGTSFLPELLVRREVIEGRLLALPLPGVEGMHVRTHFIRRGAPLTPHVENLATLAEQLLRRRFPARGA